mgnify:CR=1 FL=1
MKLFEAKALAINLMNEHGLLDSGWHFEFDNAKRRFGVCNFRYKRIGIKNTILHEIAHALVGRNHGHDWVWRAKAIEIGCDGHRCYNSQVVATPKSKYEAVCKGCGTTHKKHKRPTRSSSCGKCSGGRYNEKFKLEWKVNY